MSLWGPALDAEIEYRRTELSKAWGNGRSEHADRAERADGMRGPRRAERAARSSRASRTEQIRTGIDGMSPSRKAREGRFA